MIQKVVQQTYKDLDKVLANESLVQVDDVTDEQVNALPTGIKAKCLEVSAILQNMGIKDDPVIRLKRAVKVSNAMGLGR